MQIVIDIDEDTYRYMQSRCMYQNKGDKGLSKFEEAGVAIKNGTPLPKGHGRLISEPTEEEIAKTIGGKNDFADCIREAVKTVFANVQTIIDADKAESEDKE